MFDYLKGFCVDKRMSARGSFLTIDVGGLGYLLEITETDFSNIILDENNLQKLFVTLIHKEDSMNLYGFISKEARDIFLILLSVSGVGAKMALALLNEFDVYDLITFVIEGDFKELTRAKGVGPKLAQKIILELKDKLIKTELPRTKTVGKVHNPAFTDAEAIMLSLGYSEKEVEDSLNKVMVTLDDTTNAEEILRKALTYLST